MHRLRISHVSTISNLTRANWYGRDATHLNKVQIATGIHNLRTSEVTNRALIFLC